MQNAAAEHAGRIALVTGASDGMGRAVALGLVTQGAVVVAVARGEEKLSALVRDAAAIGGRVVPACADLGTAEGCAEALSVARTAGPVQILVNNVGSSESRPFHRTDDEEWRRAIDVNLMSAVRMARGCLPAMRELRWGRIVSVASLVARQPDPYLPAYSASKAALLNLSKSLAGAYGKDGVTSNCVLPGFTDTALMRDSIAAAAEKASTTYDVILDKLLARDGVPVGRLGQPGDVAAAVLFLVSEAASWITGAGLSVDGGMLRSA
jgi:3-oxoacyl-[acyl-carrier protein] reductase